MKPNLDNNRPLIILGDCGSGKSNLLFYFGSLSNKKNKYLLGYPEYVDGYTQLNSLDDIAQIHDCVLLIDELSKYFAVWDKKSNIKLIEMLQFAEHNNIKLIASTQITQAITKQIEAFIGQYAIKQIRMFSLKNGSMAKNILKNVIKHPNITSDFVKLQKNEFVWYNDVAQLGENGVKTFPDMKIGKHWGNKNTD